MPFYVDFLIAALSSFFPLSILLKLINSIFCNPTIPDPLGLPPDLFLFHCLRNENIYHHISPLPLIDDRYVDEYPSEKTPE